MKVRLYRGPFNGQVMEHPLAGRNEIRISGYKRETRKQKAKRMSEFWQNAGTIDYLSANNNGMPPVVRAVYRICIGPHHVPLRHPDGSIFYEYEKPRKK